ncbi:glycoside hydrolase family 65 protein [Anaerotalea alkaliphila]|uniref:Glycoside hydrolase family 65 protein n=1 Tax=Anaerotalea alkaliphila TaxID=2662126 RepID=A0A7X5HWM7_9FIRM|nr:glycoside hydrolase family 65 protein [Anaerotalea alkaliphila]NDL68020.1 glycoside hydrolase family 65 protein [Anaerotalea alkaliphila]
MDGEAGGYPEGGRRGALGDYPLLLHYHPLTVYRHKVLKRPDTVLAHLLLDNESDEVMRNSFEYYEKYTTHDSSMTDCVHSMLASRIGDLQKAYDFFRKSIQLDLDDLCHNTVDGLHMANAGGVYMSVVYGFGGVRIKEDGLHLHPGKPKEWERFSFKLNYRGKEVEVMVGEFLEIRCKGSMEVIVNGKRHNVYEYLKIGY